MMKHSILFILIFLMFAPSMQIHADVVFFDIIETHQIDSSKGDHQLRHHWQDSENKKNTEHFHHCTLLGVASAIVLQEFDYQVIEFCQERKQIFFNKCLHTSNYLEGIFQPPKTC